MLPLKKRAWYIRLMHLEYWPSWVFYVPVWIQHPWLAIKARNFFFFLSTNPAIDGFVLSDSKYKTLQLVPEENRPKMFIVHKRTTFSEAIKQMQTQQINFPIILKPDIGYRGLKVMKIINENKLQKALETVEVDYIVQEYLAQAVEVGIFYYRYPNENKGHIPSITIKDFLSVTGDGIHTLAELVQKNHRSILQQEKLAIKFKKDWHTIIKSRDEFILEEIGNHNRGTKFINGNALVDESLLQVFNDLSHRMPGFYFGRFDIKVTSLEALKNGAPYYILEVNGVGGEPTHIYDPSTNILKAWKDLSFTWQVAAKISKINFDNGIKKPTYTIARTKWNAYQTYKRKLHRL